MPITAAEIAKMCNVSRTTVDRALKNKPGISAETRERICALAKQYDYRPNYLASALSTGATKTIGVIVFDLFNEHFAQMIDGIERFFSNVGLHTYICISHKDKAKEKELIQRLVERKVDGILMVPINDSPAFSEYLRGLDTPVICLSNRLPGLPYVSGDNFGGVYQGMELLYARGFRQVYFVCPPLCYQNENIYAQKRRAEGYRCFMNEHGDLSGEIITQKDYPAAAIDIIRTSAQKPAFFCSSDLFMLGIRKAILDQGMDINECCALMGVDGLWMLDYLTSRPPTVIYPADQIGEAAARMLYKCIHGKPVEEEIIIPCAIHDGYM